MMNSKNATLFVYVQALGGKFLGPNAFDFVNIKLSLKYSGGDIEIPYSIIATTNDGNISPVFTDGNSSSMPILTTSNTLGENPTVNYLTANLNTVMGLSKSFTLPSQNELATLSVMIPTPSEKILELIQPVWLIPEQEIYKVLVVVPGLLLVQNPVSPTGNISVFVKMMCGCKVTVGLSTSFWSPSDFMVNAFVTYQNASIQTFSLSFDEQANDSLFSGEVDNINQIKSINFYAQQLSTGNYGSLEQIF
jgi:hypothetical protein